MSVTTKRNPAPTPPDLTTFLAKYAPGSIRTYVRRPNGQLLGVLVAIKERGDTRIGWSKCNAKLDRFDKDFGVYLALKRALVKTADKDTAPIPGVIVKRLEVFAQRAAKYFAGDKPVKKKVKTRKQRTTP